MSRLKSASDGEGFELRRGVLGFALKAAPVGSCLSTIVFVDFVTVDFLNRLSFEILKRPDNHILRLNRKRTGEKKDALHSKCDLPARVCGFNRPGHHHETMISRRIMTPARAKQT